VGRAYLCALAEPERQQLLSALQLAAGDDWAHLGGPLESGIKDARAHGFAIAIGEGYPGLNAVAAGFTGPSGERFAVNCGGAATQCSRERLIGDVAPTLLDCIARIVQEIG